MGRDFVTERRPEDASNRSMAAHRGRTPEMENEIRRRALAGGETSSYFDRSASLDNQTVQRVARDRAIRRKEGSDAGHCGCGQSEQTQSETGLTIGQPGDRHEVEADQLAARVMSASGATTPANVSADGPRVRRKCGACEESMEEVHRKEGGEGGVRDTAPKAVADVLSSPGERLDAATLAFMEPRFGHDFGNVRVHTDERASSSARAVNAQAYTVADHVVFGRNQYSPATHAGRSLLAHELAHTMQQEGPDLGRVLQKRVMCPPGMSPDEGTGCRSEAGTCADKLQASAAPGTGGCWDDDAVTQATAPSSAPTTAPWPYPMPAGGWTTPSFDTHDDLRDWNIDPGSVSPDCRGNLCHARHPNMAAQLTNDCFVDPDTKKCRSKQGRCDRSGGYCSDRGGSCRCVR